MILFSLLPPNKPEPSLFFSYLSMSMCLGKYDHVEEAVGRVLYITHHTVSPEYGFIKKL